MSSTKYYSPISDALIPYYPGKAPDSIAICLHISSRISHPHEKDEGFPSEFSHVYVHTNILSGRVMNVDFVRRVKGNLYTRAI